MSNWLRFCADDIGGSVTAGAVHTPEGAVPVTAVVEESNSFYQWGTQLAARGLPSPGPSGLLVGQRRGYQTRLLTKGGSTAEQAAPGLLDGVRSLAAALPGTELLPGAQSGPVPCVAGFVSTGDVLALRAAGASTLPVLLTTDAWVSVPEGGWAEWLATLPSKGRRDSVKQEVKAFAAAGYEITRVPLSESYEEAAGLLADTQKRYGHPYDLYVLGESFRRQSVAMGRRAEVLFCARPGERPVGFSLFYIHGDTLFVRAVGFDYERLVRGAAEYFNLVYYASVRIAQENGLRWIHPGIESPDAKALRGARLRPLWLLDLTEDSPLEGRDDDVRAHNAARLASLGEISPAVSKALESELFAPFC
ncbi:GNAT family N-acetyltransferase [Streptomyces sp. NPDC008001]|uniref:GNAT family N-acetyltransferase n=1 Tax=Streptomyces sp. NPDC008001 TaxID=3364804 RepID=UPI0036E0D81C